MMDGRPPCPAPPPAPPSGGDWLDLHAPPSWRCIDFVSDLHLHAGLPRTYAAFAHYLQRTPADALFILGDLFEVWVGDDMREQPFEAACTASLAQAGRRLHLHLMVGNRDFLLGQEMASACHARLVPDPTVLDAFGARHLLTHGDAWCLADTQYLAFRAQVRDPAWQQAFLAQPLARRLDVAQGMRQASEQRRATHAPETYADVDALHADTQLTRAGAHTLVHGHTHRPESGAFTPAGARRHVLSDWDLDQPPARAEVLRLTAQGFQRLDLDAATASTTSTTNDGASPSPGYSRP